MSNANRDYAIVYDIKNSSLVLSRPLVFYVTDKNTSNIFVRLVTRIIIGDGIDQYTDIENATNYVLTMRVIKPNDEIKSIQAIQHEPESLFQFDLTEDFKDIPGKYICELTISNIVNERQEFITSDPFNYEVKRSILSKANIIVGSEGTTVEKLLNDLDATKAELSSQIKGIKNNITFYRAKQTELLTTIISKNINNTDLSVCCQGDSLTAGGQQTSTVNYPKYLQLILQEISGTATISVVNRGHGGDTTALSYDRWDTNPNCDLHLVMLGTNDQYAGLTIQESYNNMLMIIKRILDWNSAIVLLTPPRKKDYNSDIMLFNNMVKNIGNMLNIPVIDTTEGLKGYPDDELYVSDNVHLTDKGYYELANYISIFFIGSTLVNKDNFNILGGKHITMDAWQGHMRLTASNKISSRIKSYEKSTFGVGETREYGSIIELGAGETLNIAFNSLVDNLYLFPYFEIIGGAECQVVLNYRSDPPQQSCKYTDRSLPSSIENNPITKQYYSNTAKWKERYNSDYIVCTRQGINQLYIKNVGTDTVRFMGFYAMSAEEFKLHKECENIPVIKTGTLTTTDTTGRIEFDTPFNNIIGITLAVEKYQSTDGKVTYYNQGATGFNYTVDSVGVKFRWIAFGY